jgi:hypothetical protein
VGAGAPEPVTGGFAALMALKIGGNGASVCVSRLGGSGVTVVLPMSQLALITDLSLR